jgi:hypothetical protein
MQISTGFGWRPRNLAFGTAALVFLTAALIADPPQQDTQKKPVVQLPVKNLDTRDWLTFSTKRLEAGEIDRLVNAELAKLSIKAAPLTSDDQFIRRVTLDLTGKLPTPADINTFLADKTPNKRAKLIDKLLDSPDFARHWAQYWRVVITSRTQADFRLNAFVPHFENWMREQLSKNRSWAQITHDILTATGKIMNDERDKNGQAFFLISRKGADAPVELAAETSRIFLGIQIQCAQCHDHPSDVWKRHHFHEFTAYFARTRERPLREEMRFVGSELVSLPFFEHRMPDKDNPKTGTTMNPKFLDGKQPTGAKPVPSTSGPILAKGAKGFPPKKGPGFFKGGGGMTDEARRAGLAEQITDKNNPWFAAAFVNRIWGEFMGQSFYAPIDDIGPQKDGMMPTVLARVSASFRGNDYDIKQLMRDILNSETYQRQIRPGESGDEHLLFASHNPVRMNGPAFWQTLNNTLGPIGPGGFGGFPKKGPGFGKGFPGGLENQVKQEFDYDPSTKAEEIEGSIAQALILMNNLQINNKIKATGNNMLGRVLANFSENDEALRQVYLKTLARRPTDREVTRCREHIRVVGNRAEAFEDILWALINSTEYQMKR